MGLHISKSTKSLLKNSGGKDGIRQYFGMNYATGPWIKYVNDDANDDVEFDPRCEIWDASSSDVYPSNNESTINLFHRDLPVPGAGELDVCQNEHFQWLVTIAGKSLAGELREETTLDCLKEYPTLIGLSFSTEATDLAGIEACAQLEVIMCSGWDLRDVSHLQNLTSLKTLEIVCRSDEALKSLHGLPGSLTCLKVHSPALVDISDLSRLQNLENLDLNWCSNLVDLAPVRSLFSLVALALSSCENLSDLSPISGLVSLRSLNLSNCLSLVDLSPIAGLNISEMFYSEGCKSLSKASKVLAKQKKKP